LEIGIVARLKGSKDRTAIIRLGDQEKQCKLQPTLATGIGWIQFASASFENAKSDAALKVQIEGMKGKQL